MSILKDRGWKLKYTPDDGSFVRELYQPALACAVRYDRLTGYFRASALALAARGIEGLVFNGGRMRMVVGCTLHPPEIEAIEKGEDLRAQVAQHFSAMPLMPADDNATSALELLAWMVAKGLLDVRVGIPCDDKRRPIPAEGLFHEKAGIIEDKTGDCLAFNGSLNETAAGWTQNWESLNVFTSWDDPSCGPARPNTSSPSTCQPRCATICCGFCRTMISQRGSRNLPPPQRQQQLPRRPRPSPQRPQSIGGRWCGTSLRWRPGWPRVGSV